MRTVVLRVIWSLVGLAFLAGCAGLAGSNIGDPTSRDRFEFKAKLRSLHVGMPADSLELLFAEAKAPGETGILHRAKIVTQDFERVTYSLGWKSDPKHQLGVKDMQEIDVERASVLVENSRVVSIELWD